MSNQRRKNFQDSIRHHLPYEERKRRKQSSRERHAGESRARPRRGDWSDYDEDEDLEGATFEVMRSAPERVSQRTPVEGPPPENREDFTQAWTGLVLGISAGRARVRKPDRSEEVLPLKADLAARQQSLLAVGDEVRVAILEAGSERIEAVLPRRSYLARPDPSIPERERLLAANVDWGLLVLDGAKPRVGLVDRALIALSKGAVRPRVCVHKSDALDEAARSRWTEALAGYEELDQGWSFTSCTTGEGIDDLRANLTGSTAVLFGQSGVGKSSLLNALDSSRARSTGAVRDKDRKGRHTTTASELVTTRDGTSWIDTPGVRAFGLWNLSIAELLDYFPELQALAAGCRFRDCQHDHEPACAVRAAAEVDDRVARRWQSYLRIRADL